MVPIFTIPVPTPTIALSTPSGRKSCKPFLSLLMFPSQEAPIAPGETLQVIFSSMLSIIFSLFENAILNKDKVQIPVKEKNIIEVFVKIDDSIKNILRKISDNIDADRLSVYVFHNGLYSSGR